LLKKSKRGKENEHLYSVFKRVDASLLLCSEMLAGCVFAVAGYMPAGHFVIRLLMVNTIRK
jgi:hypothetical protein